MPDPFDTLFTRLEHCTAPSQRALVDGISQRLPPLVRSLAKALKTMPPFLGRKNLRNNNHDAALKKHAAPKGKFLAMAGGK